MDNSKLSKLIDLIQIDYDVACKESERYFDYMYKTIQYFVTALAALIVFAFSDARDFQLQVTFSLIIPVLTYIFGLFYNYNAFGIAKIAYFKKVCEIKIRILTNMINAKGKYYKDSKVYVGWETYASSSRNGFLLPYGTLLAFFIALPASCIWYSIYDICAIGFIIREYNTIVLLLSLCCLLIYYVFMVVIIIIQKRMIEKINQVSVSSIVKHKSTVLFNTDEKTLGKNGSKHNQRIR